MYVRKRWAVVSGRPLILMKRLRPSRRWRKAVSAGFALVIMSQKRARMKVHMSAPRMTRNETMIVSPMDIIDG
jgi:hypothetical protein